MQWVATNCRAHDFRHRATEPHGSLELAHPAIDQVVAHVRAPCALLVACIQAGRRVARQAERGLRNPSLRLVAAPGDPLDHQPVAITGSEVHPSVGVDRVLAQDLVHDAQGFDEAAPVHRCEEAQAADRVSDGDLVGGLDLVAGLHQLLGRQAVLGQSLLDPGQCEGQRRALALQAAHELGHERCGHRRIRTCHVRDHQDQVLGIRVDGRDHPDRPAVGEIAIDASRRDTQRHPADVLNQGEPQHDRDRPELPEVQRRDTLIRRQEAAQAMQADSTISMRDRLERDVIDPREAGRGPLCQARELPAVVPRQVPLRGADLLLDQVKIIEQPFAGGRHAAVGRDRIGQLVEYPVKYFFVGGQPR